MDMNELDFPPFLIFVPSNNLENDDCSQLTAHFEDEGASQIDEGEDFSRTMPLMENELDFSERANEDLRRLRHALMENDLDRLGGIRARRSGEDLRRICHEQRRLEKPARRGSIGTDRTVPTADSDVALGTANGSRRLLPSAKKHIKKIGSFPTLASRRLGFPSSAAKYAPKEMKSNDDWGASVDKRATALPANMMELIRNYPAAA